MASQALPCLSCASKPFDDQCANFDPSDENPHTCVCGHPKNRHSPCMLVFPNHCCILKFLWFLVSLFLIFLTHFRCEYCLLILSISFVWFLWFLQLLSRLLLLVCYFIVPLLRTILVFLLIFSCYRLFSLCPPFSKFLGSFPNV